ncbi:hypothetical protein 1013_scaffold47_00042 [Bacteriophage sp.]|nr:hypothetical protein 1013_scaffold47_00042 [Bacteriophage sp.]
MHAHRFRNLCNPCPGFKHLFNLFPICKGQSFVSFSHFFHLSFCFFAIKKECNKSFFISLVTLSRFNL